MARFQRPTAEQLAAYAEQIGYRSFDPDAFIDHYDMVGWVCGKKRAPMKDWRAAVRNWRRHDNGDTASRADARFASDPAVRDYARLVAHRLQNERGRDIGRLYNKIRDTLGHEALAAVKRLARHPQELA